MYLSLNGLVALMYLKSFYVYAIQKKKNKKVYVVQKHSFIPLLGSHHLTSRGEGGSFLKKKYDPLAGKDLKKK